MAASVGMAQADRSNRVTQFGSYPNAVVFRFTHASDATFISSLAVPAITATALDVQLIDATVMILMWNFGTVALLIGSTAHSAQKFPIKKFPINRSGRTTETQVIRLK